MSTTTETPVNSSNAEIFRCQVCFKTRAQAKTVTLDACGHVCCRQCLRKYVSGKIAAGQLAPTCYYTESNAGRPFALCGGSVSEAEIERLVDAETLAMYRRFQFNARHPIYGRYCPHCDHSQVCVRGDQNPVIACRGCEKSFCFLHGNAHSGRTCEAYEESLEQADRVSIATIKRTTKRCPECGVTIEKDGGCNHMICLRCGASFCWSCLVVVEQTSYTIHFQTSCSSTCSSMKATEIAAFANRARQLAVRYGLRIVVGTTTVAVTAILWHEDKIERTTRWSGAPDEPSKKKQENENAEFLRECEYEDSFPDFWIEFDFSPKCSMLIGWRWDPIPFDPLAMALGPTAVSFMDHSPFYSVPTKVMDTQSEIGPFRCQVCFEDLPLSATVTLSACGHVCCRQCLSKHVSGKIASGQLAPTCYYTRSDSDRLIKLCEGNVSETEIERLVDAKTFSKYRRFQFNAENPVFGRQCPQCDHSQVCVGGDENPVCTCEACGESFCFSHGNAHSGRTCAEYEASLHPSDLVSITTIQRTTKRCPECAVTIEKDGGCNHMTCLKCGASFCWLCLALVEQTSYPDHFRAFSLSGCAGMQDTSDSTAPFLNRVGRLAVGALVGTLVAVPALAVTAVLTVVTFGWYPLRKAYGGTVWGACRVCYYFTTLRIFNTLDQLREDVIAAITRVARS